MGECLDFPDSHVPTGHKHPQGINSGVGIHTELRDGCLWYCGMHSQVET